MRLSERHVLQAVEGGPNGEVDRLVLLDEDEGAEIVLSLDVAQRLRQGLGYFLDLPGPKLGIDGRGHP